MVKMAIRSTTIIAVRHKNKVVVAGDGQVTMANTVVKHQARKVRRLYHGKVITGFAGSTADAFTLFDKLEQNNLKVIYCGQRWNWQRNGVPIRYCGVWRPF